MNNIFYVYELQYPNGTPFYVGKGSGDRCYQHLNGHDNVNSFKCRVINKIRKNKKEPIIKIVENNLTENKAFGIEIFLIGYYGRRNIKTGILTNLDAGGTGCNGRKASKKEKEERSKRQRNTTEKFIEKSKIIHRNFYDYSKTIYGKNQYKKVTIICPIHDEFEQRPMNHLQGQGCCKCWIEKFSQTQKGSNNHMYKKYGKDNPASKTIIQYNLQKNYIKTWDSIAEAKRSLKIHSISECCSGKRKSAGGFVWKYKEV